MAGGATEIRHRPTIVISTHALDRAGESDVDEAALRRSIAELTPRLAPFVGLLGGKGKVGLMHRSAPSPVVHATRKRIEVVTVLRPGQRVSCRDTVEVWVE
jgi:hypothetical protein